MPEMKEGQIYPEPKGRTAYESGVDYLTGRIALKAEEMNQHSDNSSYGFVKSLEDKEMYELQLKQIVRKHNLGLIE